LLLALPDPPESWRAPYAAMVARDELAWADLSIVATEARQFLNPVLSGHDGRWSTARWAWE
jgi:hypothetical protein